MLRIDYEGVESCISQIGKAIEALETTAGDIDVVIETDLGNYWEGESYNKCIETYEENYQDMLKEKIPEMVEELKNFMEDCKKFLAETDSQLAGK